MPEPKRFPTMTLRQVANELTGLSLAAAHLAGAGLTNEQRRTGVRPPVEPGSAGDISNQVYELALELYALIGLEDDETTRDGPPLGSL